MGFWSAMNPLTFGRKNAAAWNALVGSYTFYQLDAARQFLVLQAATQVAQEQFGKPIADIRELAETHGAIILFNFIVYGLGENGILPALGDEKWMFVERPFIACIGASEAVDLIKPGLERKYGVKFDTEGWR